MFKLFKFLGVTFVVLLGAVACSPVSVTTTAPTAAPTMVRPAAQPTVAMNMPTPAADMNMSMVAPITQSMTTASYKLDLLLGPIETMLTPDQAKTAKSGEVMVGGQMAMNMAGLSPNYHLEVHVSDIHSNALITTATVSIQVIDAATKQSQTVPIAVMYGVATGPSDIHFGNNVALPTGSYAINVTVGSESGAFNVMIP